MLDYKVKIGLVAMRRNTTDRPRGTFLTWYSAEQRGKKFVNYIEENFTNDIVSFVDNKGIGHEDLVFDDKSAEEVIERFKAEKVDAVMIINCNFGNEEDAKDVFGIEAEGTDIYGGKLNHEGYKSVAKQLADKFGFEKVAITLRTSISANDNDWAGMLYDGENYYFSKSYHLHIVDRVDGGDSFGGGLIYSILSGKSSQEAIEFAVAASALKHSVEGDYNRVSVSEVEKLAGGDASGRVQR